MADEQITSSTANIPYVNFINVGSDQAAPSAGRAILYIKSGVAYVRLDTGDPVPVGGAVALAEGQLAVGDGSGFLSALALGTEGDVVTADAAGKATWATPEAGAGGDYVLLDSHVVGAGDEATITLTAIPGTYRELRLVGTLRSDRSNGAATASLTVNGDAGASYAWQRLLITGSTLTGADQGGALTNAIMLGSAPGTNVNAGPHLKVDLRFPAYASTAFFKAIVGNTSYHTGTGAVASVAYLLFCEWCSLNAMTSLTLSLDSTYKYKEGSILSLYGIG